MKKWVIFFIVPIISVSLISTVSAAAVLRTTVSKPTEDNGCWFWCDNGSGSGYLYHVVADVPLNQGTGSAVCSLCILNSGSSAGNFALNLVPSSGTTLFIIYRWELVNNNAPISLAIKDYSLTSAHTYGISGNSSTYKYCDQINCGIEDSYRTATLFSSNVIWGYDNLTALLISSLYDSLNSGTLSSTDGSVLDAIRNDIPSDLQSIITKQQNIYNELVLIYNILNGQEVTTYSGSAGEQASEKISEYNSLEQSLMSDNEEDISEFAIGVDDTFTELNGTGFAFVSDWISDIFDLPKIGSVIILSLSIGLISMIIGKKVNG